MEDTEIELGDVHQDKISGFKGVVTTVSEHLTGCTRIGISPFGDDDSNRRGDEEFFYGAQLHSEDEKTFRTEITGVNPITETDFSLGDRVKDDVTNFEGVVSTIGFKLYNCPRVAVTPDTDGEPAKEYERRWFDAPRVTIIEEDVVSQYNSLQNEGETSETGAIGSGVSSKTDLA